MMIITFGPKALLVQNYCSVNRDSWVTLWLGRRSRAVPCRRGGPRRGPRSSCPSWRPSAASRGRIRRRRPTSRTWRGGEKCGNFMTKKSALFSCHLTNSCLLALPEFLLILVGFGSIQESMILNFDSIKLIPQKPWVKVTQVMYLEFVAWTVKWLIRIILSKIQVILTCFLLNNSVSSALGFVCENLFYAKIACLRQQLILSTLASVINLKHLKSN